MRKIAGGLLSQPVEPIFKHAIMCMLILIIHIMRTNIVINDSLMKATLKATGIKTKREVVELGLLTVLRLQQQQQVRRYRGKLNWQGDLDAMRTDR